MNVKAFMRLSMQDIALHSLKASLSPSLEGIRVISERHLRRARSLRHRRGGKSPSSSSCAI